MQTVERAFALEETSYGAGFEDHKPDPDDKISEGDATPRRTETKSVDVKAYSLEEERRQARENWLRLRQQKIDGTTGISPERGRTHDPNEDRSQPDDNDLDSV